MLSQINSDINAINLAKASYVGYAAKDNISDIAFLRTHAAIFTDGGVVPQSGDFPLILTILSDTYDAAAQISIGSNTMSFRYHSHVTGTWTDWTIV